MFGPNQLKVKVKEWGKIQKKRSMHGQ